MSARYDSIGVFLTDGYGGYHEKSELITKVNTYKTDGITSKS